MANSQARLSTVESFHFAAFGNAEQLAELDGKFHEVLYDASQSRILRHILSDFHKYVQVARKRSVKKEDRAKKSLEEHREILNALRTGDADRAEELAHIHILNVMENLHIEQE